MNLVLSSKEKGVGLLVQDLVPSSAENSSVVTKEMFQESKPLHPGDVVSGVVVSVGSEGAWVNIGFKFEGVVPQAEMQTVIVGEKALKEGDEVQVYVLRAGNEAQQPLLSLDRALRIKGWHELEKSLTEGAAVKAKATGFNKGGLIVSYEGIQGFVPSSQVEGFQRGSPKVDNWLEAKVGKELVLSVMEVDRPRNRLILSERAATLELRAQQREKCFSGLKEGAICRGRVKTLHSFGVFVDLGGVDGLVPASELSWDREKMASELVKPGEEVDVLVMRIDAETKKIALSLRRIGPHPWERAGDKYQPGEIVEGTVTKTVPFGAFVRLGDAIEGLVHISELANRHVNHPGEVVKKGDVLKLKILSVDPEARRMRLSLRQVEDEAPAL